MSSRKEFPVSVKKRRLKHCQDEHGVRRCEYVDRETGIKCDSVLVVGRFHFDHDQADGLGGEPTFENCRVVCTPCHTIKTVKYDRPAMQKADNVKAYHEGTRAAPKQKLKSRGFEKSEKRKGYSDPFPNLPSALSKFL
jgi:5-methylcytosine-specific restriction protein A